MFAVDQAVSKVSTRVFESDNQGRGGVYSIRSGEFDPAGPLCDV